MNIVNKSKKLAYLLRHEKNLIGKYGIRMTEEGYIDTLAALAVLDVSKDELIQIVKQDNKNRFKFDDSGFKIKANQGHSIKVDLKLNPISPPIILYHGTTSRFLGDIKLKGLKRMKRHHVHLSESKHTAKLVGKRYGNPVILTVLATKMYEDGYDFFKSDNGIWLTKKVPYKYIKVPE